ncbi:MAG TPA: hypothetical protein VEH76_02925 [Methylocystis sp.]|nr:hypothetical protein [Methylocystis sp.]
MDFETRRLQARTRLDAIDPHRRPGGVEADPKRREWFEAVYRLAEGDAAGVPWGDLKPHPLLAEWIAAQGSLKSVRALTDRGARGGRIDFARARGPRNGERPALAGRV